jgi:hypothetical protein
MLLFLRLFVGAGEHRFMHPILHNLATLLALLPLLLLLL